jgi:hypothetical protein
MPSPKAENPKMTIHYLQIAIHILIVIMRVHLVFQYHLAFL